MGDCKPVAALRERAQALIALDERLRQTLPSPLREQVRLADLRDGRIVFLAPTPAWASRLRTCQGELLAAAHKLGAQASSVVVKVAPLLPEPEEPVVTKPLPHAAAEHLRKAAQSLSDHELKALFLNLASVAEQSSSPSES
ncbi:DciA family protein [Oleiagrimonas soli]|uniref:DUF721 domain-containing protein n=1 Tax=Oleiagrimonas soli TaxID=1543381 RepID=A0A841KKD5_9GAMM|nr:DciA family protein [Oleiagrimonas soli]MBB6185420.1 hypothetical protein [Oleiagrimonas soli]